MQQTATVRTSFTLCWLAVLTLLGGLSALPASSQSPPDIFDLWLEGQRAVLKDAQSISVRISSNMELISGPTTRRIESVYDVTVHDVSLFGPPARGRRAPHRDLRAPQRELVSLRVDGEVVDPRRRAQVERWLGSIGGPGVSPLTQHLLLPAAMLESARMNPRTAWETRQDGVFMVVRARIEGGAPPRARGPDGPGRPRGPRGLGTAGGPGAPGGPPLQHVTLWFDLETRHLQVLEHRLVMERGRSITIRSEMARVDGLDVPVRRTARGEAGSPRRLRSVTVQLFQEAEFSEYTIVR